MSLEKIWDPPDQPEGKRIVYLVGKDGDLLVKEFDTRKLCNKYLHRRHDSVVHYAEYLMTTPGDAEFIKEGDFKPRTPEQLQKSKARLRRKKRARRKEKKRMAEQENKLHTRNTRW